MGYVTVKQGGALTWLARPNTLPRGESIGGDWSCRAGVYSPGAAEEIAPFNVSTKGLHTDGEEYFVVTITPTQMAELSVGTHQLAIEIRNPQSIPVYENESVIEVRVESQLIPAA